MTFLSVGALHARKVNARMRDANADGGVPADGIGAAADRTFGTSRWQLWDKATPVVRVSKGAGVMSADAQRWFAAMQHDACN